MKSETRAIRDAARLLSQGKSVSYVLGWIKAGGFTQAIARQIIREAQQS